MKTITYNPETHVLVPREPSVVMAETGWDDAVEREVENVDIYDIAAIYRAMLAAAPQPEPVESEPVAYYSAHYKTPTGTKEFHGLAENPLPAGTKLYTTPQPDRTAELEKQLATQKEYYESVFADGDKQIAKHKVQSAELEAALKVARDGIDEFLVANDPTEFGCACDLSVGYLCGPCHADMRQQPLKIALAKINEVLK